MRRQKSNRCEVTDNQPQKLTVAVKSAWAVGELPVAVYVVLTIGFLTFYATTVLGIEPWLAGAVLLVPRLWDAFTDPLMGAISDRTQSKMGRRRPYLLIGTFLLAVSVTAMFFAPTGASQSTKAAYLLVTYLIASTAITIYDVPYSSMAAEMSPDYNERTSLTGYKMIGARVGTLMILFGVPALFTSQESLAQGFQLVGLVFGAVILISGIIGFRFTRAAPRIESKPAPFKLSKELKAVLSNKPFRLLWLVFLFQNLAIGIAATMSLFLLRDSLAVGGALPLMMAAPAVVAMLATPIWVAIGRRIGKRPAYFIALALAPLYYLPILFVPSGEIAIIMSLLFIIGFGDAANQLLPNAMVPDTVEADQLRTGERREGAIFGAWAFCRKFGMTTGAFIASLLLSVIGFEQGPDVQQTDQVLFGLRQIYVIAPAGLWLCALVTLLGYKLTKTRFEQLKSEISAQENV